MFCWREILPFGKPRSLLLKDLIYVKKNKTHEFFSSRILKVSFLTVKQGTFINYDFKNKSRNYPKQTRTSIGTYICAFVVHLYVNKQKLEILVVVVVVVASSHI